MAWKIEVSPIADCEVAKLDAQHSRRILKFLYERVAKLNDPRSIGKAMQGPLLGDFWGYRVGDDRLICKIDDDRVIVLLLRVGHRREIYR